MWQKMLQVGSGGGKNNALIQGGSDTYSWARMSWTTFNVTFPTPFNEIPTVYMDAHAGGTGAAISVRAVTKTGFSFEVATLYSSGTTSGTIDWVAYVMSS